MIQQDFKSSDDALEYAAQLIEETGIEDWAGVWAKRKRVREDSELRHKTAQEVRKACAAHVRAMKQRPDLTPIGVLRHIAEAAPAYLGHAFLLRDAWPLAWKGWVNIECTIKCNDNCIPPETIYRVVLTDEGREVLANSIAPTTGNQD